MSEGDGMAEVTEGDRETARDVADRARYRGHEVLVKAIAAVLAEEREKARAPFLALADELDRSGELRPDDPVELIPHRAALAVCAERIRTAAEEG